MKTWKLLFLLILAVLSGNSHAFSVSSNTQGPEIDFALERLEKSLAVREVPLLRIQEPGADLELHCPQKPKVDGDDGFSLHRVGKRLSIEAENARGVLYGVLDLADQIERGVSLDQLKESTVHAQYPFRAIKFNLPWFSYRDGENLAVHTETCRDLEFWRSFLDMMVENKFNTLTLWNLHPYIFMVRPKSFPEASPFSDDEMAEWHDFWTELFRMARERGIDSYVVNWNIFVSAEFAEHYGGASQTKSSQFFGDGESSPAIEQYTRELVTQTIDEYPDLTGIGLTLGERMGGMDSAQRKDWVDRTIIAGLKQAKRKARLIYRAPLSANLKSGGSTSVTTEKITRDAVEGMGMEDDVWIEFKFNWSHGHTSPRLSIVHGGMLTDTYWTPPSDQYKAVWTMRNEDFFVLRWAQPDFIREFIRLNQQPYVGGCLIGSECYIPAKDYITRAEHQHWDYAFQRQWLFYKIWGCLLFNPDTPDRVFAQALEDRFPGVDGTRVLTAWKLSSNCANRLGSFYQGTWDATLYSEAFAKNNGKLISVEDLLVHSTLDPEYLSIADFVKQEHPPAGKITPLHLADQLDADCVEAARLVADIPADRITPVLEIELNDILAWCSHGHYFAEKLRGGVALARFRKSGEPAEQKAAIRHLTAARAHWMNLVERVEEFNVPVMPYQFDPEFSWRKQVPRVDADITAARKAIEER